MKTVRAYTNDKGNRLFTCTKVGRKWATGIWWEYPIKLVKIPLNLFLSFENIPEKQSYATSVIKKMAIKSHGSRKDLPTGIKKVFYK